MSRKTLEGKEDLQSGRGNELVLPSFDGTQADPAEDRQTSSWWWFGLGDAQGVATNEEDQPQVAKTTSLAKGNVDKPQGVIKMNTICRNTPRFRHLPIKNSTKKNVGRHQEVVKGNKIYRDMPGLQDPSIKDITKANVGRAQKFVTNNHIHRQQPRCPRPTEKANRIYGMTLQDDSTSLHQLRKTKRQTAMNNTLGDARNNTINKKLETTATKAKQSGRTKTVTKVGKVTKGTPHMEESESLTPPEPVIPEVQSGHIFNSRATVAVLLVFNMILVQLFGYFWYCATATDV